MSWRDNEDFRTWLFLLSGHGKRARDMGDAYVIDCDLEDDVMDLMCQAYLAGEKKLGSMDDETALNLVERETHVSQWSLCNAHHPEAAYVCCLAGGHKGPHKDGETLWTGQLRSECQHKWLEDGCVAGKSAPYDFQVKCALCAKIVVTDAHGLGEYEIQGSTGKPGPI